MNTLAILTVFFPLLGFIGGVLTPPSWSQVLTCSLMILSTLGAFILLMGLSYAHEPLIISLCTWMHVDFLDITWGIQLDSLSLTMMAIVTFISLLVHFYSIGYMKGDPGFSRFMGYLSLFTFFMLALVTSPNFLQLFFGWEGVGFCSYLLIGYWYDRESANAAAIKAFLVNRIGDLGFLFGMFILFTLFETLDFSSVFSLAKDHHGDFFLFLNSPVNSLTLACLLFFIGAMGKSAQIGLHTWLPDAMEGPTPVSALIHAATMVTAGVFLVVRISPLLEYAPLVREVITLVGAVTAFMAATIACVQNDIKRIIAYSTCSQLGYMFIAAGLSGYSAAMFHLTTHAFFKALLFLGAGSIIHAMSDEHNIQQMGGIWKYIPVTYAIMWIGSLALAGIPFFAGFYSKDIIFNIGWVSSLSVAPIAFILGMSTIFLTAFYAWRLLFLTFHGIPKANDAVMGHLHEAPFTMLLPLMILGIGSITSGYLLYTLFVGEKTTFWGQAIFVLPAHNTLQVAHHVTPWIMGSSVMLSLLGIGIAYLFYIKRRASPEKLALFFSLFYTFLKRKWYFDILYTSIFVKFPLRLGHILWKKGDHTIVDGIGPNGVSMLALSTGRLISRLQTGYVYHYAFAMILGVITMVGFYFYRRFLLDLG